MKSVLKLSLFAVIITAFSFNTGAQTCERVLETKSGKVYSAVPGDVVTTASSNSVTIRFKKTDGKAETQVNFYINNQMQVDKTVELPNGNWKDNNWRTVTLTGTAGKAIKVKFVNQSATNTINYECRIVGASTNLETTGNNITGMLAGQQNKTIYTLASCTGKTRIRITRTAGQARANIRVWQKVSGNWQLMDNHNQTFEGNDNSSNFVVNSSRELKVELRNVSVGNTISHRMEALVSN